jgi:hypothetical protein
VPPLVIRDHEGKNVKIVGAAIPVSKNGSMPAKPHRNRHRCEEGGFSSDEFC